METLKLEEKAVLGLKYNPSLWISEGSSRFSTKWKNRQILWSVLLARLKNASMTQETQAEYMAMTKNQQDKIKDVGGFVGGTLSDGHRKSETVKTRSLVTFDLDFAPTDFVEQMILNAPYGWAIYSTHKHNPKKPRLRLIAPLDRAVDPDEYEAITRKMAEEIGMDYFDSTTFQPSRLMYWPSYSRDAEYVFEYNDGPAIKADEILAKYPDWRDVSFWPLCKDEIRVKKTKADRQQDPLKKQGAVGVFCRTYDVPAAIATFLPDVYLKTEKDDRYTYAQGSTFGGLVIYDDGRFCYSNHGTDPAHGQDLNAFDLVRIHKFGGEDDEIEGDVPATRLPSYKSMMDMITHDKNCIKTYDEERRASAASDFDGEDAEDDDWMQRLTRSKSLEIEKTINNLVLIFENDYNLRGLRFDELSGFVRITEPVPWKKELTEWKNADDGNLLIYLAQQYTTFRRQDIIDVMTKTALDRKYNPIKEYLQALPEWDGVPRVETLFIDYLGAEDNIYTREAAKRWLLAAVSRIYRPGCKFDYVPVLSGPPGIGKSTLAMKLGAEWFSDSLSLEDMKDKTAAEKIQGVWIMEIGELKGMRKTDVESVKSFVSRQVDNYRPSYGRAVESHPRTCVCIGTSNADDYLRDVTGNRRFWPIPVSGISEKRPWDLTDEDVAQIWSEVMFYYEGMGERSLLLPKEARALAEQQQLNALEYDERTGIVEAYLERKLPENWPAMDLSARRFWLEDNKVDEGEVTREDVTIMEIWAECFRKMPTEKKRQDSDDIVRILMQLGWRRSGTKRSAIYGTQKAYKKA